MPIEFTDEPGDNRLQIAGDLALDALKVKLKLSGLTEEDFSVVMCIEAGEDIGTVLHIPGGIPDDEVQKRALQTQLQHAEITAMSMGLRLSYRLLRIRR